MRYSLVFFVFTVLVVKQTHSETSLLAFPSDNGGTFTKPNSSPLKLESKIASQSNHASIQTSGTSMKQSKHQSGHYKWIWSYFWRYGTYSCVNAVGTFLDAMKSLQKFLNADLDELTRDYNKLIQANSILTSGLKPYTKMYSSFSGSIADVISTTQQISKIVDQNVVPQVQQSNSAVIRLPASITNKAVTILHQMANDFKEMTALLKTAVGQSNTNLPFLGGVQKILLVLSSQYAKVHVLIEQFITAFNIPSGSVSEDITIDLTHGIKIVNEYIPDIIESFKELQQQFGPLVDLVALF